jgi:endoglucanase
VQSRFATFAAWILVGAGLLGCDPGSTLKPPIEATDTGSNEDVGAGDLGPTPVELHGRLHVDGTRLADEAGEPVQLKGVSSMWLNWEADGYAEDPTALRWMRNNWHLTVVRASMGVEPAGAYLSDPEKSLAQVDQIVANAVAAGVYVILDWHDHHAHQHEDQAVAFFAGMAKKYGDLPNVLFEPFNEPMDVDWPTIALYHEAVVKAIRGAGAEGVIILGTPTWSQDVDVAADAPVKGENLAYTLHFYSCTHTGWLRQKADAALALGAPLFVTEWGATSADGGTDGQVCLEEASAWHEWMNGHGVSWAVWKLDNCAQDATCLLVPDAPSNGGWTGEYLHGHGKFARARMQED